VSACVCVCLRLIVIQENTGPRCDPDTGKEPGRIYQRKEEDLQAVYLNLLATCGSSVMTQSERIAIDAKIMYSKLKNSTDCR